MTKAEKLGKKAVWAADQAVNLIVLLLLLLLLLFGCYSLWDSHLVYQAADSANYTAYKPDASAENGGLSFTELRTINPDVFGWLTVYDTTIDYPVVQAPDNEKYLNTAADGSYSLSGALFLDYENAADFSDYNSIIYGHHMDKNAMFGEIGTFTQQSVFDSHRYGSLYYGGREYGIEFFAFLAVDAYQTGLYQVPVTGEAAKQKYLDTIFQQALFTRDVGVTTADRLVLLSTCTSDSTNGRHILAGRLTDTVQQNPADLPQATAAPNTGTGVDEVSRQNPLMAWMQHIPRSVWHWILVLFVVLLILVFVLYLLLRRREKRRSLQHRVQTLHRSQQAARRAADRTETELQSPGQPKNHR